MAVFTGRLTEIWLENDVLAGRIDCKLGAGAAPGQYFAAQAVKGPTEVLPVILFPSQIIREGFRVAPPIPSDWQPGTDLQLKGPLGKGFCFPPGTRRVGLLPLDRPDRLLYLARQALSSGAETALVCEASAINVSLQNIPSAMEINPLSSLPAVLAWADYLAVDLTPEHLPSIRRRLGLHPGERPPCPIQVLVKMDMPCSGLADCGVCAVKTRHGYRLACKDGPVFDLNDLEW